MFVFITIETVTKTSIIVVINITHFSIVSKVACKIPGHDTKNKGDLDQVLPQMSKEEFFWDQPFHCLDRA